MQSIGVVIPTYNRADFINETLRAVLGQSRPPDEVVVVDDGSTDNTQEVLTKFGNRVRTILVSNGGDIRARNIGTLNLKTDLVAFCDSDDIWEPSFLQTSEAFWNREPQLTAFYSNFRILRDGTLASKTKLDDAPAGFLSSAQPVAGLGAVFRDDFVDRLLRFQPLFTSCMVAHRERLLALGGWDEGVERIIGCDFATALKIAAAPPVGLSSEPLVQIRKHAGNISGSSEKMNFGDAEVLEYVLRSRPQLASKEAIFRNTIATRRGDGIDAAFARGDYKTFNKYYTLLPENFRTPKRRVKRAISMISVFFGGNAADRRQ